jgi:nucleotide-binding universal stress UspA family protein
MYRHILIPTDGSEIAEHGVAHGLALAKSLGAKVSVIVVVEPFSELTGRFREVVARYAELRKEEAASAMNRAANAAKEAGVSCATIQVENAQPHQAIIAAAKDKGCDLIVMSSHGRSGLSGLLIGSVTNKVLTHTKTPVLVCQCMCKPLDGSNKSYPALIKIRRTERGSA